MNINDNLGLLGQTLATFLKREDGGNAAEFALVALPMGFFTLAIMQVGALFFTYNDLHNAAREGARRMAVEDGIVYGDNNGTTFDAYETAYTCDNSGTTPLTDSVEEVVCGRLVSFDKGITVQARANSPAPPATTCYEVSVRVRMDMADAAIFDIFNLLSGNLMQAEAKLISEYNMGTLSNNCE